MEKYPITARSLERFYHVKGDEFERQYKDHLSGYRTWAELDHADEWLVYPQNVGPRMSIDETSLSNGELYTIVTNRDRHCGKGSLVAIVAGTCAEDVINALEKIPKEERDKVEEITLDLSESINKIVRRSFSKGPRL